jgi:hypothetical protein
MQAMLNPVVCVAFHRCWRAVPRDNCCRMALRTSSRLADCRGDKLQHYGATRYHYTAGTWQTMTSPTSQPLESVAAVTASDVWAVGGEGTILHYNGATWSVVNGPR